MNQVCVLAGDYPVRLSSITSLLWSFTFLTHQDNFAGVYNTGFGSLVPVYL